MQIVKVVEKEKEFILSVILKKGPEKDRPPEPPCNGIGCPAKDPIQESLRKLP